MRDESNTHAPPSLAFAFEVRAEVGKAVEVGLTPRGHRRIVPILGGVVEGPGIKGVVLPGGADWQLVRSDGVAEIQARYTLDLEGLGLVYVVNSGIRRADPAVMARLNAGETVDESEYYFRTVPQFETAAPGAQWLMQSIFVATGKRNPTSVEIRFWRVL
jgi:hypothetical protein